MPENQLQPATEDSVPSPGRLLALDLYFACGHCEQNLAAGDEAQGLTVECPLCGGMTVVPTVTHEFSAAGLSPGHAGRLTGEEVAFLSAPLAI